MEEAITSILEYCNDKPGSRIAVCADFSHSYIVKLCWMLAKQDDTEVIVYDFKMGQLWLQLDPVSACDRD